MYTIKTNPIVLARVSDALEKIELDGIPSFKDDMDDVRDLITTKLIISLTREKINFNSIFQSITGTEENFIEKDYNDLHEIIVNFLQSTGDKLTSWKLTQSVGSNSQGDMDILQIMDQIMKNPQMMEAIGKTPTDTENTTKP